MDAAQPILRITARVVPVCASGEVLLLQEVNPARPGQPLWGTVGGAVDAGETLVAAALRELLEETGVVAGAEDLTEPFHQARQPFSWDGTDYLGDSTFFALRLDRDVDISFDRLEPEEIGSVIEARWWRPEDLTPDLGLVWPDLASIAATAVGLVLGRP